MSNLGDDPQIVAAYAASMASQAAKPFFVKWGAIPEVTGNCFALKSAAHSDDDFVFTCGDRVYLEESAQFMNAHLLQFPPAEDSIVLHDTLIAAIEEGAFVPSTVFPG